MHAIEFRPDRPTASKNAKFTIHMAFLLLFPGFFFYQSLLGLGIIGAVLGGYFTIVALILTFPLIHYYIKAAKINKNYFLKFDFFFILFIIYYFLVLAANFATGANAMILQRYVQSMIFCVDIYIIFRMVEFTDKKFVALAVLCLVLMSVITIYFSIDGFFYLQAMNEAKNPENLATYQGFARSYIYTFLIVVPVVKSIGARFLLYGLASCSLFLNGARSEFSAVLFLIPIVELYYSRGKLYLVILGSCLLIWFALNAEFILGLLPENRILQLFDLSNSSSVVARQQLSSAAWSTIVENPILGDFASYPDGNYAHNILCAWVDFGLAGLVFFSALLIWPAFRLFSEGYFLKEKSGDFVLACSFICITILWVLTAKNIPDMSVGASLGAFAKYQYAKRNG